MFVIQITGGREFTDYKAIYNMLLPYITKYGPTNIIIRHGNARGADKISDFQARRLKIPEANIQSRPVSKEEWDTIGLSAGNKRNIAMLEEKPVPNVVLAFPDKQSKGTWHMIDFAAQRAIETYVYQGALGLLPEVYCVTAKE